MAEAFRTQSGGLLPAISNDFSRGIFPNWFPVVSAGAGDNYHHRMASHLDSFIAF